LRSYSLLGGLSHLHFDHPMFNPLEPSLNLDRNARRAIELHHKWL
jgi:hypothetical protein